MGYIFQSKEFWPVETKEEFLKEYKSYRLSLFRQHGNAEDAGQLSTLPSGLDFRESIAFTSRAEAIAYIEQNHERHSKPIAVKAYEKGITFYIVGGWCNS